MPTRVSRSKRATTASFAVLSCSLLVVEFELRERLALAMYAERNGCDALVTASEQLATLAGVFYPAANAVTLAQAFAVLGLHLRLREDFVVHQYPSFREGTSSADFYASLARCLLNEWWRWNSLCPGPDSLLTASISGLAEAVVGRLARALRARDRLHGFLLRKPSPASIDEAVFYFEAFVVAIGGAFDAAARVVHKTYELAKKTRPSWRSEGWTSQLGDAAPALHRAIVPGTSSRAAVDAVFVLRNLVHDEPLKIIGVLESAYKVAEYRAAIPENDRKTLVDAVEQLGGAQSWGLDNLESKFLTMDLGQYAERLLPAIVVALNEILRLTEVERLGVDAEPPFGPHDELAAVAERLRLLGGV